MMVRKSSSHSIALHQLPNDALHLAAANGDIDQIQIILATDPDALNRFHSSQKTTPICWAIQNQQAAAVLELLRSKPDLLAVNAPYGNYFPISFLPEEPSANWGDLSQTLIDMTKETLVQQNEVLAQKTWLEKTKLMQINLVVLTQDKDTSTESLLYGVSLIQTWIGKLKMSELPPLEKKVYELYAIMGYYEVGFTFQIFPEDVFETLKSEISAVIDAPEFHAYYENTELCLAVMKFADQGLTHETDKQSFYIKLYEKALAFCENKQSNLCSAIHLKLFYNKFDCFNDSQANKTTIKIHLRYALENIQNDFFNVPAIELGDLLFCSALKLLYFGLKYRELALEVLEQAIQLEIHQDFLNSIKILVALLNAFIAIENSNYSLANRCIQLCLLEMRTATINTEINKITSANTIAIVGVLNLTISQILFFTSQRTVDFVEELKPALSIFLGCTQLVLNRKTKALFHDIIAIDSQYVKFKTVLTSGPYFSECAEALTDFEARLQAYPQLINILNKDFKSFHHSQAQFLKSAVSHIKAANFEIKNGLFPQAAGTLNLIKDNYIGPLHSEIHVLLLRLSKFLLLRDPTSPDQRFIIECFFNDADQALDLLNQDNTYRWIADLYYNFLQRNILYQPVSIFHFTVNSENKAYFAQEAKNFKDCYRLATDPSNSITCIGFFSLPPEASIPNYVGIKPTIRRNPWH